MRTEITINQYELEKILGLLKNFNDKGDDNEMIKRYRTVTLIQEGDNGIGTTLNAQFFVVHKGVEGDLTVSITDVEDW
jgi:hypothetical protein